MGATFYGWRIVALAFLAQAITIGLTFIPFSLFITPLAGAFPVRRYYGVWARASDQRGRAQPMLVPDWNPKDYLNNACHRVAVRVA